MFWIIHQAEEIVGPMTRHQLKLQLLLDPPILGLLIHSPHYHTIHSILLPPYTSSLVLSLSLLPFPSPNSNSPFPILLISKCPILFPLECFREVHRAVPLKTVLSLIFQAIFLWNGSYFSPSLHGHI